MVSQPSNIKEMRSCTVFMLSCLKLVQDVPILRIANQNPGATYVLDSGIEYKFPSVNVNTMLSRTNSGGRTP